MVRERAGAGDADNASPPRVSSSSPQSRLTNLLIAKSIIEALFVTTLVIGFYYLTFNPFLRGSIDEANVQQITGWVADKFRPDPPVEVQLYIDDRFAASSLARPSNSDALSEDHSGKRYIFKFDMPTLENGEHEARVYVVHKSGGGIRQTLKLIDRAARFKVESNAQAVLSFNGEAQEREKH